MKLILRMSALFLMIAWPIEAMSQDGIFAYKIGDFVEARKQLTMLASTGNTAAQSYLGLMYFNGHGVPQVYSQAEKWFRSAAEGGNALGQYYLGVMYEKGTGVDQDLVRAHKWYNLAASKLPPNNNIAMRRRDELIALLSAEQVRKAQELAEEQFKKESRLPKTRP